MHARVTRSKVAPGKVDETIVWFEQTALPQAQALAGFRGALELVDRESGEALTMTFWESAEALGASESAASGIRNEGESALEFEILGVERYEVAVNTL